MNDVYKQAVLLFILLLCDMTSLSLLKAYHVSHMTEHIKLMGTILINNIVPYVMLMSLNYDGIGNTNFYWNILSTVFVFIIAIYFFGEQVTNTQFVGIVLSIFGVFLVLKNGKK